MVHYYHLSGVGDVAIDLRFVVILIEVHLVGYDPTVWVAILPPNCSTYERLRTITLDELLNHTQF